VTTNQKEIFVKSEGNSWFDRNNRCAKVDSADIAIIKKYTKDFTGKILEIGCSNGSKLNVLRGEGEGCGIDPSEKAIKEGIATYPDLNLFVGTSDKLHFQENYFDIVIFGFCLYLVDRELVFRTLSEADRVLKDKGFLIITDFDPSLNIKKKYHHCDGVFSYKQQYENLFLSNPIYTLIEKKSYSHHGVDFHPDKDERVATTVLYKDIDSAYVEL
jgi:ubiquinone/menaquinone biosynthesis C-methylase UbiE